MTHGVFGVIFTIALYHASFSIVSFIPCFIFNSETTKRDGHSQFRVLMPSCPHTPKEVLPNFFMDMGAWGHHDCLQPDSIAKK